MKECLAMYRKNVYKMKICLFQVAISTIYLSKLRAHRVNAVMQCSCTVHICDTLSFPISQDAALWHLIQCNNLIIAKLPIIFHESFDIWAAAHLAEIPKMQDGRIRKSTYNNQLQWGGKLGLLYYLRFFAFCRRQSCLPETLQALFDPLPPHPSDFFEIGY
jgi:hypothetical protein